MSSKAAQFFEIDDKLHNLHENKSRYSQISILKIIEMLSDARTKLLHESTNWRELENKARGIKSDSETMDSVSGITGYMMVLRQLDLLKRSLQQIHKSGTYYFKNRVHTREDGQVVIDAYPLDLEERLLIVGIKAQIHLQREITKEDVPELIAKQYREIDPTGMVTFCLGVGNISALGVNDILHYLVNKKSCVLFKTHPLKEHIGDIIERVFDSFIKEGFLQVIRGDIAESKYASEHPFVDQIHLTGSDKTFETIVYGAGDEGERNKANQTPVLGKKVCGELGNVSPVIIVPGPWTDNEIRAQVGSCVHTLIFNQGFNCLASRVFIQNTGSTVRDKFLNEIKKQFQEADQEPCYYPGCKERIQSLIKYYPQAQVFGSDQNEYMSYAFLAGLEPSQEHDTVFQNEVFGPFCCEALFDEDDTELFIDRAVNFCNDDLWGTLNATILVHPKTLNEPKMEAIIQRAIGKLKYGVVTVNESPAVAAFIGSVPWGGYPGSPDHDIQSGNCFVNNLYMLEGIEKTVLWGPLCKVTLLATHLNPDVKSFMSAFQKVIEDHSVLSMFKLGIRAVINMIRIKLSHLKS